MMSIFVSLLKVARRYRVLFQVMFFMVLGLGVYLGMRPAPPPAAYSWMAVLYHAGGLFACTLLSWLAFPRWYWWLRGLLMFAVGVAVEYAQSFHPTRSADMADIYANSAGVATGLLCIWVFLRVARSR